jgi:Superfamily II DNA/RNA helicases, SNF2 family
VRLGGNRATRHEDDARFLTDPECRVMIATPAAGGRGNTWVVADLVVYYANSHDLEHRIQSEDRAHRGGQTRTVTYVDLMALGTIDEKIVSALRRKIDIAAAVAGDGYREWLI